MKVAPLLAVLVALPASAGNVGVRLPAAPVIVTAPLAAPTRIPPSASVGSLPHPGEPSALPGAAPTTYHEVTTQGPAPAADPAAVGAAIAESKSVDEALAAVVKTGALSADKVPQDPTDRLYLLKRMWDHAAPAYAEGKIAVDAAWAVPALRVQSGETTYLIHPVGHGQLYPPGKRAVGRLVTEIRSRGEALYSEQGLPAHYLFSYGRETADHQVNRGLPITVGPAADGMPQLGLSLFHDAVVLAALTPLALAAHQALLHPSVATLVPAALYAALLAVVRTGLLPFNRLEKWLDSREARRLGAAELSEQLEREARALHRARPDPLEVLRLHLPPGPGAASDPFAARSEAMARAVAGEAAAAGSKVVHLLVGYRHAADIGWRLRSQLP